jgi:hypothetical protein
VLAVEVVELELHLQEVQQVQEDQAVVVMVGQDALLVVMVQQIQALAVEVLMEGLPQELLLEVLVDQDL